MLTLDKIYHAAYVLKKIARKTDMIAAPLLNTESNIFLKTENLQVTGSFKVRGAYYKISQLSEEEKSKGVIASSAGNHAQGVALAAQENKIPCTICMPDGAPISKVEATKSYGAKVCLVKGAYDEAYEYACKLQKEKGYTFIHPECKVYDVQSAGAPSMKESMEQHQMLTLDSVSTFADGIAVKHPGDLTYELVNQYVDGIVTVTDDETAAAVLALIERQKLIAEGAGAVAVAAAMYNKVDIKGKKTVCLLSGGNIDVNILSRVIARGLMMAGRSSTLTIALEDKPGQLQGVSEVISRCGGNVVSVHYSQADTNMRITSCYLHIGMETRDHAQVEQIKQELAKAGFNIVQTVNG